MRRSLRARRRGCRWQSHPRGAAERSCGPTRRVRPGASRHLRRASESAARKAASKGPWDTWFSVPGYDEIGRGCAWQFWPQASHNSCGVTTCSIRISDMEPITGLRIRDFRVRGNYLNQHSVVYSRNLRSLAGDQPSPDRPGYSRPVVEFELPDGNWDSV